jgi:hypothetical protein
MPRNLVVADVAVTLLPEDMDYSPQAKTVSLPDITFGAGDGSLLYPALGIPMPDLSKFGMRKEIKRVHIEQPANGYVYHFDRANHKLRILQGAPAGGVAAPAFTGTLAHLTGDAEDYTPAGSIAAPTFTGQAGPLVEIGNVAVPVTTLHLTVKGQ